MRALAGRAPHRGAVVRAREPATRARRRCAIEPQRALPAEHGGGRVVRLPRGGAEVVPHGRVAGTALGGGAEGIACARVVRPDVGRAPVCEGLQRLDISARRAGTERSREEQQRQHAPPRLGIHLGEDKLRLVEHVAAGLAGVALRVAGIAQRLDFPRRLLRHALTPERAGQRPRIGVLGEPGRCAQARCARASHEPFAAARSWHDGVESAAARPATATTAAARATPAR